MPLSTHRPCFTNLYVTVIQKPGCKLDDPLYELLFCEPSKFRNLEYNGNDALFLEMCRNLSLLPHHHSLLCLGTPIKSASFQFSGRKTPTRTVTWPSLWVWILRWHSTTITTKWSTLSLTPWCRSSRAWETSKIHIYWVKVKDEPKTVGVLQTNFYSHAWHLSWIILFYSQQNVKVCTSK